MGLTKKYLILGGALIMSLVLVYLFGGSRQSKLGIKNNSETSRNDSLIIKKPINPTGTFLLYQLLKNYKNTSSIVGLILNFINQKYVGKPNGAYISV